MVKCKDCIYWVQDALDSFHSGIFGSCSYENIIDKNITEELYKDKISNIKFINNPYNIKYYDFVGEHANSKTNGSFGCINFKSKNNDC